MTSGGGVATHAPLRGLGCVSARIRVLVVHVQRELSVNTPIERAALRTQLPDQNTLILVGGRPEPVTKERSYEDRIVRIRRGLAGHEAEALQAVSLVSARCVE